MMSVKLGCGPLPPPATILTAICRGRTVRSAENGVQRRLDRMMAAFGKAHHSNCTPPVVPPSNLTQSPVPVRQGRGVN